MELRKMFVTAGNTNEQVVSDGRCRLIAIRPQLTTTGTITLRNQATAAGGASAHQCAIGLTQQGKDFNGAVFERGLTIQLSAATDITAVIYERF